MDFSDLALCPLPENLRKKISQLEFMDMADLWPEAWLNQSEDPERNSLFTLFKRHKEPVTDIATWVQCYASLTLVLAESYPAYTPR